MKNLADETVLVTGINDMVGMHLSATLRRMGAEVVGVGDLHGDIGSLTYLENEILRAKPSLVFHVPGHRYGIAVHKNFPGDVYYESVVTFAHLLEASRKAGVKKVVNVLSNCVYPEKIDVPYKESEIWEGLPETTLIPHGMARRMSIVHGDAYRQQYGIKTVSVVLASVYGSNDNFDPKTSQVMASMVRRFVNAADEKLDKVVCWGTGSPTREFIHVRDAVIGLLKVAEHYDDPAPLNIGSQNEISIKELTETIARVSGYEGVMEWDTSKPDGRARVCLDCSRMRAMLPKWDLLTMEEGVRETTEWFRRMDYCE
jgi:nucleoside-diphosphate-sugar epimerase